MNRITIYLAFLLIFSCTERTEKIVSTFDDGSKRKVEVYEDEIKIEEVVFYKNGQEQMAGPVNKEGQRDGAWKSWYEDGKIWTEGQFINGKRSGVGIIYYTNGQKRCEGDYTEDKPSGKWVFWDDQGKVQKEIDY
ncbi:MAG: hypothetical protein MRY83_08545 [Flavobacteriales bacterium]|nr:hypothetical protein [Flavobacteriales bacterium]